MKRKLKFPEQFKWVEKKTLKFQSREQPGLKAFHRITISHQTRKQLSTIPTRNANKSTEKILDSAGLLKVLSFNEVTGTLGNYLSFNDMKNLRLVSKSVKDSISSSNSFLTRTRLFLDHEFLMDVNVPLKSFLDKYFLIQKTKWRKVQIDMSFNCKRHVDFEFFKPYSQILRNTTDLIIRVNPECTVNEKIQNFIKFISQFTSLEKLAIDSFFSRAFTTMIPKSTKSFEEISTVLGNLTEFKIIPSLSNQDHVFIEQNPSVGEQNRTLLGAMKKLKSFEVPAVTLFARNQVVDKRKFPNVFNYGIYELAKNSLKTIVKLDLNLGGFFHKTRLEMEFPFLKYLKLRELKPNVHPKFAYRFLLQQPLEQLEFLSLEVFDEYYEMPGYLIDLVKFKCENLQGLELRAGKIATKWDFLTFFKSLRQLSIFIPKSEESEQMNNSSNKDIISYFPDSLMKEVRFRGMKFQSFDSLFTCKTKLVNLVSLNLLECPGAFDDRKIQFIAQNLKKLEILQFSHCPKVTDFGLTGIRNCDQLNDHFFEFHSLGINKLQHLKELRMISCENISDFSCQFGLKFRDLRSLDLSTSKGIQTKITCNGILYLLSQNPLLGQLYLGVSLELEMRRDRQFIKFENICYYFHDAAEVFLDEDDDEEFTDKS